MFIHFSSNIILVPSAWLPDKLSQNSTNFRSVEWNRITHSKIHIVNRLIHHGLNVFFTDVDLVWLSPHIIDYVEYFAPQKDFIYSMDNTETPGIYYVNTGFYVARSTNGTKEIFSKIIERQKI